MTKYITAYTGATEADGMTPFINISTIDETMVEVIIRNRNNEVTKIFIPNKDILKMANDIITNIT